MLGSAVRRSERRNPSSSDVSSKKPEESCDNQSGIDAVEQSVTDIKLNKIDTVQPNLIGSVSHDTVEMSSHSVDVYGGKEDHITDNSIPFEAESMIVNPYPNKTAESASGSGRLVGKRYKKDASGSGSSSMPFEVESMIVHPYPSKTAESASGSSRFVGKRVKKDASGAGSKCIPSEVDTYTSFTDEGQQPSKKHSYTHQCKYCNETFRNRAPLNLHVSLKHQDQRQSDIMCQQCGKEVTFKHELDLHIRFACRKTPRPIVCVPCALRFPSEDIREEHRCTGDAARPYGCGSCDYVARLLRELTEHEARHRGLKPFLCPTCGVPFVTKKDLDRHSYSHKSSKDFQCEDCGSLFKSVNNLRKHVAKHKNTGKFKCGHCDYTTSTDFCLHQHLVKHSARQFVCELCHKTLRSKTSLKQHVENRHTFNRVFSCHKCDFKTNVGLSFSSHMRIHNRRNVVEIGNTCKETCGLVTSNDHTAMAMQVDAIPVISYSADFQHTLDSSTIITDISSLSEQYIPIYRESSLIEPGTTDIKTAGSVDNEGGISASTVFSDSV